MKYEWEDKVQRSMLRTKIMIMNQDGTLPKNVRVLGVVVAEMEFVEAAYIETHQVCQMEGADMMQDAIGDMDAYRLNCLGEAGFPFADGDAANG
jgi:hypothetical protein